MPPATVCGSRVCVCTPCIFVLSPSLCVFSKAVSLLLSLNSPSLTETPPHSQGAQVPLKELGEGLTGIGALFRVTLGCSLETEQALELLNIGKAQEMVTVEDSCEPRGPLGSHRESLSCHSLPSVPFQERGGFLLPLLALPEVEGGPARVPGCTPLFPYFLHICRYLITRLQPWTALWQLVMRSLGSTADQSKEKPR